MTDTITATPSKLIAGDSISWLISLSDYPASSGWSLSYVLLNALGKVSISATASGNNHLVALTAAVTAAYVAGTYKYTAYVTKTTERYTVESGDIEILPNLAVKTTFDGRTYAETCLENIEAVIAGKATADNLKYMINGRSLDKYPWSELIKVRGFFRAEVKRERRAATGKGSNKILSRFV